MNIPASHQAPSAITTGAELQLAPGFPIDDSGEAQAGKGVSRVTGEVRRILVVDDSSTERTHLELILTTAGYQVRGSDSGASALAMARDEVPDLVLLDIVMADMDGFRTCRELKRDPQTADVPVIMVSSKNNKADFIWAQEQGAQGYIVKPFTDEQVLDEVRRF